MAQYTMTNTAPTYSMVSTYQTREWQAASSQYKWSNATTGRTEITFDFRAIPDDATIDDVAWTFKYSDSRSGAGYNYVKDRTGFWNLLTKANLLKCLAENKKLTLITQFTGNNYVYTTGGSNAPTAVRYVSKFTITVIYTVNSETYICYGTTVNTGETIVWNQLHNFSADRIWCNAAEWSINDRITHYMPDSSWSAAYTSANAALNANHVYLFSVKIRTAANTSLFLSANGNNRAINTTKEWKRYSMLVPHPTEQWGEFYVVDMKGSGYVPVSIKDWCVIDLTRMYGAGHEPDIIDDERIEFIEAYADRNPQYNAGELIPVLENVWQKCEPYYIENGVAQKCLAYYGANGEWVQC